MASGSSLVQLGLIKIDKLCDAKFITKIIKTTKTDFSLFVKENGDLLKFLTELEKKIDRTNEEYKESIEEYLATIPDEVLKFRNRLKEIKRQEKLHKKEIEKEALKAEIRQEMEAAEKKKALEEKLGIQTANSDTKLAEEKITEKALSFKKPAKIPSDNQNIKQTNIKQTIDKSDIKEILESIDSKSYQKSMDLGEFFEFLKEVVKNDLLIIKSDKGRLTIRDLDLDDDIIRIKVE